MSSKLKDKCIGIKCDKPKICNPNNGNCINDTPNNNKKIKEFYDKLKQQSTPTAIKQSTPTVIQQPINVTKTVLDFIRELEKYKTATEVIENALKTEKIKYKDLKKDKEYEYNEVSKQGFIYELLWDLCIKLNIFIKNNNIHHTLNNFNNPQSCKFETIKTIIDDYLKNPFISSKSGGYSDITFKIEDILYLASSKYYNTEKSIADYDIQKLCPLIERENKNYKEIKTLLFVKNRQDFIKKCKNANKSSDILIKYISPNGNYENVYDLNDLEKNYTVLYNILKDFNFLKDDYQPFKEQYLKSLKSKFIPRFHQELFIEKITSLIKKDQKKILVGAIPRSGKTYIMSGTILKDSLNAPEGTFNNYIIITPAPNETLDQYYKAFTDYYDFNDFKIRKISENGKLDLTVDKNKHNVFLISKQRLGFKKTEDTNTINTDNEFNYTNKAIEQIKANIKTYFGDNKFRFIFFDEAHFGMTTSIAQDIFNELDELNKSYKIYVTATYNKPKQIYKIEDKNIIKWDLNDIKLIKNIKSETTFYKAYNNLESIFGNKILNKVVKKYNNTFIFDQYKNFPEPYLITSVWDKEFIDTEISKIGTNKTFGFDMGKLFAVKGDKFENKEQLIQFLEYYFGYYTDKETNNYYETKNEYKKRGIIPIIENVCLNHCRTLQTQHKTTQLWFLPPNNIKKEVKALIELLKDKFRYIFNSYMFYIAVDKDNTNDHHNVQYMSDPSKIKNEIEILEGNLKNRAEYSQYKGLIILAGNRLQLGISLSNVDIVSLFTNISASDAIYQMLFRSMTEIDEDIHCDGINYCARKRYGFMVDLNPQRTLYTIDYLTDIYLAYHKDKNSDKKYELIADLINIDRHKFIDSYNKEDKKGYQKYVKEFFNKLYTAWDAKSTEIKEILIKQNIFANDIFKSDYDITKLFNKIEKSKIESKSTVNKPDTQLSPGKKKRQISDIIKLDKKEKKATCEELWVYLFSEVISILSLITSYTKEDGSECILTYNNTTDFIYDLQYIIKNIKDEEKTMLLYTLKQRIVINDSIDDTHLFNLIYNGIIKLGNDQQLSGGNISDINKQIHLRKYKLYNITEPDKLLIFINENLKPKIIEKKERGEVFTPMTLVNEMLDTLPESVWFNKYLKWLDPAAGMGNFPVAVYMRLMKNLKDVIKDEEKRRKHILENMLYMVELDKKNVFMMKKIFCGKKYKLNIFEGSFIDFKHFIKVDIELNFDIILGNPPFQYKEEDKQAQPIWHLFIKRSYEELLNDKGYLLFVHPSGWRDIDGITRFIYNYIKENNLIYLSMTSFKESQKIFSGVSTNFDYYLVQNIKTNNNITIISDIDNINNDKSKEYKIDLNNWNFIPSGNFNKFKKILTKNNNVKILHDRSMYGTDKKNTNKIKNNIFKYPICNSINKDGSINFIYSNNIDGHFGIPKVIWSNGAGDPIIDINGDYGMSEFSSAIVDNKTNLKKIKDAMISERFINLMKYLVFKENHTYNYKIIALFKKDFYKYFLPKNGNKSVSLPTNKLNKLNKRNKSI
jgi:hypothetical protein